MRKELAEADTLAAAVRTLRVWAGSHDKLAEMLGSTATRQRIIDWEKGARPQDRYREQLIAAGVPAPLFQVESRARLERRLDRAQQEISEIREALEAL